jgi:tetratricopeptide (TPR) repeat protein/glycosyltransferase involved in cell wall biosynthesis
MASQKQSQQSPIKLSAEDSLKIAWEYHQAGRLLEAESLYRQVIAVHPESANVLCLLGVAVRQQGRIAEAIAFYEQAIAQQPDFVEAHLNKAHVLLDIGEYQNAIACYAQVIQLAPNSALAYDKLGWLKQQVGDINGAIDAYQATLKLEPNRVETAHNLGNIFHEKGLTKEAIACYTHALEINPNSIHSIIGLGTVLQQQGKSIEAIDCYQQGLKLDVNNPECFNNIGAVYHEQGKAELAISYYQQALNLNPNFIDAINNLGHAFVDLGQFEQALSCHYRALELQPENSIAHLEYAITLLLFGDLRRGFVEYEWRWQTSQVQLRQFQQPVWDGSSLHGKTILLHVEQGFGDSIQFIRYAPILSSQGAKVIVACYPELMRLFATVAGVEYLSVSWEDLPTFDVQAPLMSLPRILDTTWETIPANIPYLAPPAECKFALSSDAKLKVGIVWAGSPKRRKDHQRSCNLSDFMQLLDVAGIAVYSLQKNLSEPDRTLLHQHLVPDLSPHLDDFADTASAISQLDLVISVDTSVAHLAGALGKSVWVLLSFAPDWRWLLDRDDNPWYPTARLFRQIQPGNWQELFDRVKAALSSFAIANTATDSENLTDIAAELQQAESLMNAGDQEKAIALYEQIIYIVPNCVQARINLGFIRQKQGELDAAILHYREALRLDSNISKTVYNLATVFQEKGDLEQAIEYYHKTLELQPNFVAAINNLGAISLERCAVKDAITYYRRVLALNPEYASTHLNLGLALLLMGDYDNGFAEYEWRWKLEEVKTDHSCFLVGPQNTVPALEYRPLWDGSDLQGKTILLHPEQGLGDSIQFVRYAAIVQSKGGKVMVGCYPQLQRLFSTVEGIDLLVVKDQPVPEFDVQAPMLSLPHILGTTLETIPANTSYITTPADCKFELLPDRNLKVGIVWAGSPRHHKNSRRSCNLNHFLRLLEVSGVSLYSLQKELLDTDCTLLSETLIIDLSSHLNDFADTAAAISQLDLVITIDTAVAHLAGALGKPVWVLLAFSPDWRWLLDRDDNPWYPTARLFRQTRPEGWEELFEEVKAALSLLVTTNIEAQLQQAESLMEVGDKEEAIALYEQIISADSNCVQARINLGFLQQEKGELDAAIPHYIEALNIDPNIPQTAYNLAKIFEEKGQSKNAMEHYQQALGVQPDFVPALINLAVLLQEDGKFLEAVNLYRQVLEVQPYSWEAYNNLGTVLQEQGDLEDALEYYHKALELLPDFVEAINNLGRTFLEKGAVEDAIACYRRVIALNPEHASAYLNLSLALLLIGDLENGFVEYEWRWKIKEFQSSHSSFLAGPENLVSAREYRPLWDGSDLHGKTILLHAEQGLGDSIQFVRYAAMVQSKGGRVIVGCYSQLMRLFATVSGIDLLIVKGDPIPAFDVQVPMLSLPYVFGTTLETIPGNIAYITASTDSKFAFSGDRKFKVGIVWAGNPKHRKNTQRSCGLSAFLPLFDVSGVSFYSLQKELLEADRALLHQSSIVDLSPHFGDLADTAAAIAQLDLVITVDTAVAHLAGALGKPVWILLAFSPDWRWLLEREDSPWYPTARLFRQSERGDWEGVFERVRDALESTVPIECVDANLAEIELFRGRDLQQQGEFQGAIECYERAIAIDANNAIAYSNLGVIKQQLGELADAIAHYRQALAIDPNLAETLSNLGSALADAGETAEAIAVYDRALSLNPNCAEAWINLGLAREEQGDLTEAISCYQQGIQVNPNCAEAYYNLGIALEEQGKRSEAIANYERAIRINPNPDFLQALNNLGKVFEEEGQLANAIECYHRAIELQPNNINAFNSLGIVLQQQGKFTDAVACYSQGVEFNFTYPEAHLNLALALLLMGDLQRGFFEYEWRMLVAEKQFPTHDFIQPIWDGQDLDGKTILLCPEQGLGDAIQFIRYARIVQQKGGKVIVWCPPNLHRLFEQVSGIDELIVRPESAPDFDVRAQLVSLPHILGTTLESIPANVPYLAPPPGVEFTINETPNFKVGIVWSGNPHNSQNKLRSVSLDSLMQLFDIPGVNFYSLQRDIPEEERTILEQMQVTDLSAYLHDFADTAAAISALDLVISVDTAVAHLAGALGKPVWILLCFTPDWRWMLNREDSPWYPSARLFRQDKLGDWEGVFERLASALKTGICQHQPERILIVNQPNLELAQKQFNRGNILKSQGKITEAIAYFKNALVCQPDLIEAATNLAVTLHQIGDLSEAATYYLRSIEIEPNSAQGHNNLGILRQSQGNIVEAISCFQNAISLDPLYVMALNNLGALLQDQGELSSAIACFEQALSATSNYVPALINLGVAMEAKCQPEEAKRYYQQSIELEFENPKAHYYLGTLCFGMFQFEQAIVHLEQAILLHPDYVEALNNLGSALEGLGDIQRAISCYHQALIIDPNCAKAHFNLAIALLLTGDLPRGFAEYESRWETDQAKKMQWLHFEQPVWDGSDLQGKTILLRCEQGLGDAIQFVRYAPIIQQKGGKVVVSSYQELKRLFKSIPGIEKVAVTVDELPDFDWQAPLMSLPYILGTDLDNIPANIPYLSPASGWNFSLDSNDNFKIGIVWAGSSEHLRDFMRSTDLSYFLKLLDIPRATFYNIQKELSAGDRTLLNQIPVIDLRDNLNDFADTAAVISQLDLVICVDTAVAHLAGALGKPVWILLSFVPDWRWMLEREDSPWYPTARLFRQEKAGDWEEVFDRVKTALQDIVHTQTDRASTEVSPLQSNLLSSTQVEFYIANALQKQGKKEAAIARYEQVIAINPQHPEAHNHLGYLKQQNGLISEAISHYQQALEINPNQAQTNLYLGCTLEEQGKVAEAIEYLDRAIQQSSNSPSFHLRLALALLLTGNLERGFVEYEWRWKTQELEPRYFAQPLWDGDDLHGKTILLHPEQGLGDTIHFIRYAALVKQKGGKVIIACHQSLKRLFEGVAGIDRIVSRPKDLPNFQVQAPLMSLPKILGTTWENLPVNIPYLSPPQNAKFALEFSNQLKVGIVWSGGLLHRKNNQRSCKLTNFIQFLDVAGATFYSLQKNLLPGDRNLLNQQQISDLSEHCVDFADTAAIISQLDLVICVDTSVAHLAGALGKPVWILLSFIPDWRWMLEREDSPWYPTARLFRQEKAGDWDDVCDRIKTALQDTVRTGAQDRAGTVEQQRAGTGAPPLQSGIQPPQTPIQITGIGISWPVSVTSGWGIYGMNLTLQLLRNPAWEVALLAPPSISEIINPLHKSLLLPVIEKQRTFQELVTANSDKQITCNFPVLYGLGNNLVSSGIENQITSACQVGVIFFEDTRITAEALEKAKKYSVIVAGSNWNADVLRSCGLTNVAMVNQGIDPAIFHPAPKSNLFRDRFVIFSGGKLEYRKGQDIVIAAFKRFHAKYPEALLITTWHNFWPQYMLGIEQTGNVVGLPHVNRDGSLGISQWLVANGLSIDSFIDIGLIPNHLAGQILREADAAVFTNRCEGGTNLVAMESMACGIPTILSANTGHLDLIHGKNCYPLSSQRRVKPTAHFPGVEGWGESEVDEVVEALEQVYTNREQAKSRGLAAANFMLDWTWEKKVKHFLDVITL